MGPGAALRCPRRAGPAASPGPHRDVAVNTDGSRRRPPGGGGTGAGPSPRDELAADLVRAGAADAEPLVTAVKDGLEQPQLPPQEPPGGGCRHLGPAPPGPPRRRLRPRRLLRPRPLHLPMEGPAPPPPPPQPRSPPKMAAGRPRSRKCCHRNGRGRPAESVSRHSGSDVR